MSEKKKLIIRNDVKKNRQQENRQQVNFSVGWDLHLSVKDLHTSVQRRRGIKIKLADFQEEVMAKGVKEFDNQ